MYATWCGRENPGPNCVSAEIAQQYFDKDLEFVQYVKAHEYLPESYGNVNVMVHTKVEER